MSYDKAESGPGIASVAEARGQRRSKRVVLRVPLLLSAVKFSGRADWSQHSTDANGKKRWGKFGETRCDTAPSLQR